MASAGTSEGGRRVPRRFSVRQLVADDTVRATDVLAEAFRDYPVMRWILPPAPGRDRRLGRLMEFFVTARLLRGEPALGIEAGGTLAAVALVSFPEGPEGPPELAQRREALWEDLGAAARARYERCGEVWSTFRVDAPHVHLNVIGVSSAAQGRGLGRVLLEHVQDLSRSTPGSRGVTLTTEDPANVRLYEHVGYEVRSHARIAPELETWGMFRRN